MAGQTGRYHLSNTCSATPPPTTWSEETPGLINLAAGRDPNNPRRRPRPRCSGRPNRSLKRPHREAHIGAAIAEVSPPTLQVSSTARVGPSVCTSPFSAVVVRSRTSYSTPYQSSLPSWPQDLISLPQHLSLGGVFPSSHAKSHAEDVRKRRRGMQAGRS